MTPPAPARAARAPAPPGVRGRVTWVSLVVIALVAAPRVWAAIGDASVFCPQEIYESMEPAHRLAFGWGLVVPQFAAEARSWVFPGVLAVAWKVAATLGLGSSLRLVQLAKLSMAGLSITSVWLMMSLARCFRGERAAVFAGLFASACAPLVAFGSRTFAETACAPLVVGAALLLERRGRRHALYAGALLGVAALLRYETLLIAAGLVLLLDLRRGGLEARRCLLAIAATLTLGGLLDWPTLGWPFRSLVTELVTNVVHARPASYSRADLLYFPAHLSATMGVSFAVLLLGFALASGHARGVAVVAIVYVAAHALFPQRELRFVMPVLPIAIAAAAAGLTRVFDGLRAGMWPAWWVGLACSAQMGWIAQAPTRGQLGFDGTDWDTWHSGEDYLRTTWVAAEAADLCGVIYVNNEPIWTGGYSYLHRAVPIFFDTHPEHVAAANAVIGSIGERLPPGWRRHYTNGRYALWERPGDCAPPPEGWSMTLP